MGRNKAPTTDLSPGSLPQDHLLVQLGIPKGSNNFLSTDTEGVERLVEIGTKIRKTVLATRGDFAIVKLFPPDPERKGDGAGKTSAAASGLAGEVVFVASNKDVKEWKKAGEWPAGFGEAPAPAVREASPMPGSDSEEEHDGDLIEEEDQQDGRD